MMDWDLMETAPKDGRQILVTRYSMRRKIWVSNVTHWMGDKWANKVRWMPPYQLWTPIITPITEAGLPPLDTSAYTPDVIDGLQTRAMSPQSWNRY